MRKSNRHPILALDPGLRAMGYAVLSGNKLLDYGVLSLRSVPPSRKFQTIRDSLTRLIRSYGVRTLVVEHIPKRPLDTLAGLPVLGRRLRRLANRRRLKLASFSARSVRQTVVGNGWAGKREVAESVCAKFPDLRLYLTQDRKWKEAHWRNMFDAIALGLHHQAITKPPSRSRRSG